MRALQSLSSVAERCSTSQNPYRTVPLFIKFISFANSLSPLVKFPETQTSTNLLRPRINSVTATVGDDRCLVVTSAVNHALRPSTLFPYINQSTDFELPVIGECINFEFWCCIIPNAASNRRTICGRDHAF